ncbi:MAG: small basic protein [Planctomycetota bacterium]
MSIDSSLKLKSGLSGKRSVYTRAERVAKMMADKKIDPSKDAALGIPKTRVK